MENGRVLFARICAEDWGCKEEAFLQAQNVFLPAGRNLYCPDENVFFEIVTFGAGIVVRASAEMLPWAEAFLGELSGSSALDGETLYAIETEMRRHGHRLMGESVRYLLRDKEPVPPRPDQFSWRLFEQEDMPELWKNPGFSCALNYRDDVIALGAYDGERLVSLAAADNRISEAWQIGVDTLPEYRVRGLAAWQTRALAEEIERRGKLAFYTTWPANLASTNTALRAGFRPVSVGYFAAPLEG